MRLLVRWSLLPLALLVHAHAAPSPPIRSYDFVAATHILTRSDGSLSLSFSAYNRSFEIDLTPNKELVPPTAVIEIHGADNADPGVFAGLAGPGLVRSLYMPRSGLVNNNPSNNNASSPLVMQLSHATVFDGTVLITGPDGRKHQDGWARITFASHDINKNTNFDGAIRTYSDGLFHIRQIAHYRFAKRPFDVEVASPFSRSRESWSSRLVIFRDEPEEQVTQRWGPISSCKVSDPDHPLASSPLTQNGITFDVLDTSHLDSSTATHIHKTSEQHVPGCSLPDNTEAYEKYLEWIEKNGKNRLARRAAGATGCPAQLMILPMGVAADCTYVSSYGSASAALSAILSAWNTASKIYESTFNVRLAVVRVNIQQTCTALDLKIAWNRPCSADYTISNRLSDFSNWRGNVQGSTDGIGLWHLMTQCNTQPSVGIAWLSMLCMQTATSQVTNGATQYVSGTGVSSIVPFEYKVVAHEIGHGFGAYHDCMGVTCPCAGPTAPNCQCTPCSPNCDCQGQYIMHPLDNAATDAFSTSSINTICGQFPTLGHCLLPANNNVMSLTSGICGNGVKEANEECDCGVPSEWSKDTCCNCSTCKLNPGSLCDDLNDSCCSGCKPKPAGTVCHASTGSCDLNLTCDGTNVTCATNSYLADGTTCTTPGGVTAQCASGVCTSRDLQCMGTGYFNTVKACAAFESQCTLYCEDASGNCNVFNGNFRDGTPCGSTGKCVNGQCVGGNFFSSVFYWFQSSPQIAIPLACLAVLLLVMILYSLVRCCCCNPYRKPLASANMRQQIRQQRREHRRQRQQQSTQNSGLRQRSPNRSRPHERETSSSSVGSNSGPAPLPNAYQANLMGVESISSSQSVPVSRQSSAQAQLRSQHVTSLSPAVLSQGNPMPVTGSYSSNAAISQPSAMRSQGPASFSSVAESNGMGGSYGDTAPLRTQRSYSIQQNQGMNGWSDPNAPAGYARMQGDGQQYPGAYQEPPPAANGAGGPSSYVSMNPTSSQHSSAAFMDNYQQQYGYQQQQYYG